jgi:excisionase family DNA binding protein
MSQERSFRSSLAHLSPRRLAQAIGVSESTLKRWADEGRLAVERTAGGHRRIGLAEAVAFLHRSGLTPVRPELLRLDEGAEPGAPDLVPGADAAARLSAALTQDRATNARNVIVGLFLQGQSVASICDDVIRPALERMGELWHHGPDGIFLEHRATETCVRALAEIRFMFPRPAAKAPVALGGAFGADVYRVPSAMAALVLAHAGFRERDLGAGTPASATLAAVRHYRPGLVWQSFSVAPTSPRVAERELAEIADALGAGALVVGGRAAASVPLPSAPNVHRFQSMAELAAFARGWVRG